jgi:hypothetical protein
LRITLVFLLQTLRRQSFSSHVPAHIVPCGEHARYNATNLAVLAPSTVNANGWLAGWLARSQLGLMHHARGQEMIGSHTFLAEHTGLAVGRKRGGQGSRPPSSSHPIYCCSTVMRSPRNLDPGLPCYSLALGDVMSTRTLRGRSSSSTRCHI